jgi:transcriptional regulator with XRE-family HTH domain
MAVAAHMNETVIIKKIKELRASRKLSLDKLAGLTGFTKGYLSRIENSDKAPPIYTLSRISQALGVDIAQFFSDNEHAPQEQNYSISRRGERVRVGGRGTPYGYDYEAVAPDKAGKNMEPYVVTIDFKTKTEFRHEGEELLFVLEGKLEFFLNKERFVLEQGDSIYFDAHLPHSGRSLGEKNAKMLIVVYSYKRMLL